MRHIIGLAGLASHRRPRLSSNVRPQKTATVPRRISEDPKREARIRDEIVVDSYNESERAMGWYCYIEAQLAFSFSASCRSKRSMSPLKVGEQVRVVAMAPEDDCTSEVYVFVKYGRSKLAVPLGQLDCHTSDENTSQAVADWHYWQARGYEY